ncbi:MAG: hypothetical protein AAF734_11830, partial [Bacteroidota bacterium]
MIPSLIAYQVRQQFRHWTIFLLYALLIFQGIWYTKGTFDYYVNEGLLMNAAAIFYKNLAGGGLLMVIIVAVITGPILYKEIQYKTGQWLFTSPISEKSFFVGRFLSALSINILVAFGYVIGMVLVPYVGIGEAHRFGATPVGPLLHGFFLLLLPNLLLLTSIIFATIVYFKRLTIAYLGVLITVVAFLLMQTTAEASGASPLLQLADPFGYVATEYSISLMDVASRNVGYLAFTNYLLLNRFIWLAVSLLLFLAAYYKFSFKWLLRKEYKAKKPAVVMPIMDQVQAVQSVSMRFTFSDYLSKLFTLATLELKNVVRPMGFKVIISVIVLMNILQNLLWNASYYIGDTVALTSSMTLFRLSFGVFIMILLMVWAGELFFKDRTTNFWQVADALP